MINSLWDNFFSFTIDFGWLFICIIRNYVRKLLNGWKLRILLQNRILLPLLLFLFLLLCHLWQGQHIFYEVFDMLVEPYFNSREKFEEQADSRLAFLGLSDFHSQLSFLLLIVFKVIQFEIYHVEFVTFSESHRTANLLMAAILLLLQMVE